MSHTILRAAVSAAFWANPGLVGMALGAGPAEKPAEKSGKSPPVTSAERDVRAALAAELKGDNAGRDALLAQALLEDPNYSPARWQSGYVRIDGKWLSAADAEAKYKTDRNLADYRQRRDQAAGAGLLARGAVATNSGATDRAAKASARAATLDADPLRCRMSWRRPADGLALIRLAMVSRSEGL